MKKLLLFLTITANMYAQERKLEPLVKVICSSDLSAVEKTLPQISLSPTERAELLFLAYKREYYLKGYAKGLGEKLGNIQDGVLLLGLAAELLFVEKSKTITESLFLKNNRFITFLDTVLAGTFLAMFILGIKGAFTLHGAKKELAQDKALKDAQAIEQALINYQPPAVQEK